MCGGLPRPLWRVLVFVGSYGWGYMGLTPAAVKPMIRMVIQSSHVAMKKSRRFSARFLNHLPLILMDATLLYGSLKRSK